MPINIEMPKLSDTMTEGTLVRWIKKPGDQVEVGDVLAEVETDKATMEMEAFDEGTLGEIYVQDGQKVEVGQKLAVLLQEGEKLSDGATSASASSGRPETSPNKDSRKDEAVTNHEVGTDTSLQKRMPAQAEAAGSQPEAAEKEGHEKSASSTTSGETSAPQAAPPAEDRRDRDQRVKASPLARKIARELGVELGSLSGSGPGGRIVRDDVLAAAKTGAKPGRAAEKLASPPQKPAEQRPVLLAEDQRIPLSGMRKGIAARLLESKTTIPHFYLQAELNAGPLMALRRDINASLEAAKQPKVTVNDFILKATAVAAARVPQANATFAGDAIIQFANVQLACAVAIDEGLVTPVIREAQKKSLLQISADIKDLAARARSKKLKPEEYQGGTLTVSNLGGYGVEQFFAIINPPQALIVSVGAIVRKPVINEKGELTAGERMILGLSCDHRVVDGAIGAQFLAELKRLIETPPLMLI